MSIDYDRLRELAEKHSPAPWGVHQDNGELGAYGDTTRFFVADNGYAEIAQGEAVTLEKHRQLQADYELMALAPDMARELLRLRDEVEKLREVCLLERDAAFQETPMRAGEVEAFNVCADQLTGLLIGDTE